MTLSSLEEEELRSKEIYVNNIVAMLDLDVELDLFSLSDDLPNSNYNPEEYPSLIFRANGQVTVLITNSGKLLFTGGKSVESIQEAYDHLSREFDILGIRFANSMNDIEIVNIVSTYDLNSQFDLNYLSVKLGIENVEYEPEQFPCLIYRIVDGPVVLIFSSGKIVLTGATTTQELIAGKKEIEDLISNGTRDS